MELLTTADVANCVGASRISVLNWCKSGKITAFKLPSGKWRIPKSEVDRILAPVAENASLTAASEVCAEVPGQLEIFG
ncbi:MULTISPECIES: helix-turn-helix domain-containing protein [Actinotignum]|uniref:Helix-turn-helix domain-containing protein n=1 Tax=Actinotignum sanguinis TaxID=1445614 RepID=A0ABT5V9M1_9ACTO|nr:MULTISPECIES: helix-turn-helix domain-containing protein [Actinotignum]MDE1552476.1 helix-turn-helix domain-containing protein [Actinotignum sanguinis]MDE1577016.1 helix-turn-helix domain-containing protein [Actinotignum sanguinis]MDE1655297.1 helix-turn-helix domain-containing protein [Actinotignum schaalii]MDE1656896.1 helix-turn-helix domain-containing protein [Actinotignum sanguinis]MDK6907012.1 helix-turn-helix domain-containing protein [Actinotignum timonense]